MYMKAKYMKAKKDSKNTDQNANTKYLRNFLKMQSKYKFPHRNSTL